MLLESLARSAAAEGTGTEQGCIRQRVHWRLDLDSSGSPVGPVTRLGDDNKGIELEIPGRVRTSKDVPFPLDKGDYTFGFQGKNLSATKAENRHRLWVELIGRLAESVDNPAVGGLAAFARSGIPVQVPEGFDAGQFVAVYVSGHLPTDSGPVRSWWRDNLAETTVGQSAGQCAVCGQIGQIPQRLPVAIRGLGRIGGQATTYLVSANASTFEHHGLTEATVARVCRSCGEATHQRLNALIGSEDHRRFHRDVVLVWWASEETPDLLTALFEGARASDVRHLLGGPWQGAPGSVADPGRFDAVVLGTSVARVVVRSWITQTLEDLADHLDRWFADTAMIERASGEVTCPGLGLLTESLRPPSTRSSAGPDLETSLFACALQAYPLPDSTAQAALRRAARGGITHPLASLLRCWLTRRSHPVTETLDSTDTDPAYAAGRLLALLDEASHSATGVSMVERYYAQLSAHPGLVVGRLVDLHQHHLAKLRRDRPGQAGRLQRDIEVVLAGVEHFPAHLDLEGRARFALGLYHEQAAQRRRRAEARSARPSIPSITNPTPEEELL